FSLQLVSSSNWSKYAVTFRATGTERYISLGSFNQNFTFKEGIANYEAERILKQLNIPNAVYYVDAINIEQASTNGNNDLYGLESDKKNWQDWYFNDLNIIQNGGFEFAHEELIANYSPKMAGVQITHGWTNLTSFEAY